MKLKLRGIAAALAAAMVFPFVCAPANANLVTNGDFETGDLTGWSQSMTSSILSGCGAIAECIAYYQSNSFWTVSSSAPAMGSYAAQGPRIAIDNFLSQWLVTDPGQLYQITFAADGFGWVFFGPYNFEFDSSEWATYTVYAPALYNGVDLTFLEYGSGSPNFNPGLLDAINVDVAPPDVLVAVPQPGTISLFASGLCGLALLQWRRKSKHLAA